MRVIAGSAKGRPLHAPHGSAVRPTSDKIKGAIFSMLESLMLAQLPDNEEGYSQDEVWRGRRFLDLYAGTGALAVEALSRGAAWADLVDTSANACRVMKRNLAEIGLTERAHVQCTSVQTIVGADSSLADQQRYDIIALDPPYADQAIAAVVHRVGEGRLLRANALVVVEHSRRVELPDQAGCLVRVRLRTHGDTTLSIYRCQEAGD